MSVVALAPLLWSAAVASVSAHAIFRSLRLWRRHDERGGASMVVRHADVLLIRPCAGAEPFLDETLASIREATFSFQLRVVFAVASLRDEATEPARRAARCLRQSGIPASVVFTGARGPNRKVEQIARALAEGAPPDVVVVADSDVDLRATNLDTLVAPLCLDAALGATYAPPVESETPRFFGDWASQAVLSGSLHAFPLLGLLDPAGLVGKLFAVRTSALARAGGFGPLVDYLGEDMELARRLRERGFASRMVTVHARSRATGRSFRAVVARFARWLAVIRGQRPALLLSYPALFAATPLMLVAALVAGVERPFIGALAAAIAIVARVAVALAARRASGHRVSFTGALRDAAVGDVVLLLAFLRAATTRRIEWRKVSLFLGQNGLLQGGEVSR